MKTADLYFEPGKLILIGVSGGPDSIALLHHLHTLGLPVLAATFNHQLRGEAAEDVEFVRVFAGKLGIPFVTGSDDVAAFAREAHLSIEQAARELRYRFLFQQARQAAAQAVAVGHTADDQAETILMHFLRGSGLSGLRGMTVRSILPVFDKNIPIVRPILYWTRAETEAYCAKHALETRQDATNNDIRYFRNQLRHELLPVLEKYNPQVRATMVKTANALQGDYQLIEDIVNTHWQTAVTSHGPAYVCFNLATLKSLSFALRRNLLRRAAYQLNPTERDVDFDALERASQLKSVDIAGGMKTLVEGEFFFITLDENQLPVSVPQIIGEQYLSTGQNPLPAGWVIEIDEFSGSRQFEAGQNHDIFTAWLDAGSLSQKLQIRGYRTGDRFEQLGMPRQTVRLAELFINLKIPRRLRAGWPLLCVGNEIAWVAGLRLSERFKVTQDSQHFIKIQIKKGATPG